MLNVPNNKPPTLSPLVSGSATGNPRNKVALQPGRSLMDWIRLGNSGKDLTGVGGPGVKTNGITVAELATHNTEQDAWMAVRGKVYNVTQYFEYHPGGIPELLRGIGKDATDLFDENHRWVNIDSMLAKCYIGKLVPGSGSLKKLSVSNSNTQLNVPTTPPQSLKPAEKTELSFATPGAPLSKPTPRYEWFQSSSTVTIVIYTKWKYMRQENVIIDQTEEQARKLTLLVDKHVYTLHMKLDAEVTDDCKVNVSRPSGKVEVVFCKYDTKYKWGKLGEQLENHNSYKELNKTDPVYRKCKVVSVESLTHDTNLYCVSLPDHSRVCVPIGHHVYLQEQVEGIEIVRSYTAVRKSVESNSQDPEQDLGHRIYLMIKIYPDGALTPKIGKLGPGDDVQLSNPDGVFDLTFLDNTSHVTLCAAGTGFTPMVGLLYYMFSMDKQPNRKVVLLFFNKTQKDIIWEKELKRLQEENSNFKVHHILSQPDEDWTGPKGRIDSSLVEEFIVKPTDGCKIGVCGPKPFTERTLRLIQDVGYTDEMIHAFVG